MPEGPEIRRAADRIAAAIVDQPLREVYFAFPWLRHHQDALTDSRVAAVEPRSKALLTHFECGLSIYSHNQLYGVWKILPAGREPRTGRSLRLAIRTEHRQALLFSASEIQVLDTEGVDRHPYLARLGPDPLAPGIGAGRIRRQLENARFQRRRLADLLLDQGFVAGIGNYLRSEILFRAGLRPERRLGGLNDCERTALATQIVDTCQRAYQRRGVTVDLAIHRRVLAARRNREARDLEGPRRSDHPRFWVFERENLPCHRCARPVAREEYAGRRLYWCGGCQV